MTIDDEVLEQLRALPEQEKPKVLRYVRSLAEAAREAGQRHLAEERTRAALRWISEHRAEYAGQWVALDGDRLVASGEDGREVVARVRGEGIEGPFLTRIEADEEQAFCGGWL
jgi:hypothetical protein